MSHADRTRILIVDDHPTYAHGLGKLLQVQNSSFAVEATSRVDEALEIVARDAPDVVLVDVRMPDLDGVRLAARIREVSPPSRVLMLSVSEDAEDIRGAFRAGAVGYLSKDLETEHIAAAVVLSLGGAVVLSRQAFGVVSGTSRPVEDLSQEEALLLKLAADGAAIDRIARELVVSRATATRMIGRLEARFGVTNRDQLVAFAARRGWV